LAAGLVGAVAWAQCCGQCAAGEPQQGSAGQTAPDTSAADSPGAGHHEAHQQPGVKLPAIVQRPPHGGQVTAAADSAGFFEVVYLPQETRVYLYGPKQEPLSARGVRGQAVMRVRGYTRDFPFPLKYVAAPPGSKEQDYLAAAVDVRRIRDGDMTATFSLEDLSDRQHPKASFTQTAALAQAKPEVAVATPTPTPKPAPAPKLSDAQRIAQQKVCPVTGAALGSMGKPVKVVVKGQTVFLCCAGCKAAIKNDPDKYLAKLKK
jgi:hypothetical protein